VKTIHQKVWLGLATAVLGVAVFGGCAAPIGQGPVRFVGVEPDATPKSRAALIMPADVVLADGSAASEYHAESVRRDAALAVGTTTGDLVLPVMYEGEPQPSLWDARRLYLDSSPRRVLFMDTGRTGERGPRWWWRRQY
jgi:hypothetical protein